MDIDDILAEVSSAALIAPGTRDLHALTRAWVAERVAPELLPYPTPLLDRVLARISEQVRSVEDGMAGGADGLGGAATGGADKEKFRLIVVQTELERWKFLVRGLLRARLKKIDAHPYHILNTPDVLAKLSTSETQYLRAHQALLAAHYKSSFLGQFPPALQRLDDTAGGVSMIDAPDVDSAVFVRAVRDVGFITVEGTDTEFEMKRGDVWVVRWRSVRQAVESGDAELI
ncbi:GINS complex, Sld5 component [Pseudovirgaria hyperparasitica]|uniref:DNA replication complex GINS protein SLD5 n=1 Tax=Pseudovirgaria hyperparasitica TaxID=470096 RepID=A0A6A6W0W3_9PEZI|nr:GINS complex, Sld5 component [Pseudovirgaria hyperparasitica]KAF2755779.1 GINS complex, Sld5 component [Pseudovirgaria hyperparasitica]